MPHAPAVCPDGCARGQLRASSRAQLQVFLLKVDRPSGKQAPANPATAAQILSSYEGQNVTAIEVAGRPQSAASEFEPLFVQKPDEPFSIDNVNRHPCRAEGQRESQGCARAGGCRGRRRSCAVHPGTRRLFWDLSVSGGGAIQLCAAGAGGQLQAQTPFNAADVERDRQALITFFRQQGYFKAKVDAGVKVDAANGLANILFDCQLNRAAKFGVLDIVGASAEETVALSHSLQTFLARVLGAAIRPGTTTTTPRSPRRPNTSKHSLKRRDNWERR
jgi:outer membrane protein insertion porin family